MEPSHRESTIVQLRANRIAKRDQLRERGIDPYPASVSRTHHAAQIDSEEAFAGKTVTVAGRILSWRQHGAITFSHIQDGSGRIQLFFQKKVLNGPEATSPMAYEDLGLLDIGDFVEATGTVIRTQRGEISVLPTAVRPLVKTLRPLPDKWAGLKDRELVLRKRYIDTTLQPERRRAFEQISKMLFQIRAFLHGRGFVECLTPILQPQYGGGSARPFLTHINDLDLKVYLAISHELYLKRMIAAGFENVFTIGRYFRNEGIDRTHQPEFSMLETMSAFNSYEYNMDLLQALYQHVTIGAFGTSEFNVRGNTVDFSSEWRRVSMVDAVIEASGIDFSKLANFEQAQAVLTDAKISSEATSIGAALVDYFEEKIRPGLIQPTIVYGHPAEVSPLAKPMPEDQRFAQRFELFVGGMECSENWTEQNDPEALLETWRRLAATKDPASEEVHPIDYDFLEVLEHGMPPTTGIGPGIERMAMLLTGNDNIDDVVFFPMMRPAYSRENQAIFNLPERPADIVLTQRPMRIGLERLEQMVAQGALSIAGQPIRITPHLEVLQPAKTGASTLLIGDADVVGLLAERAIELTGYVVAAGAEVQLAQEAEKFEAYLKEKFQAVCASAAPLSIEVLSTQFDA
ncbi:MAG: lysine--tRNA ligase [Gammaproteobacteria bacterium]|nr:lysine--tRNA ligase [Gammaproteobacteria bacterium]